MSLAEGKAATPAGGTMLIKLSLEEGFFVRSTYGESNRKVARRQWRLAG